MIQINRTMPAPSVLSTSSARDRYNHPDVRLALLKMQYRKCCYCEQPIPDVGIGKQVEHFRPKSTYKHLKYEWSNLLMACGECNHAKLDQFPESNDGEPLLLDPSDLTLDPEDHITFVVRIAGGPPTDLAFPIPRKGSRRGEESIRVLGLSRPHHAQRRMAILGKLRSCLVLYLAEDRRVLQGNGDAQEVDRLRGELREATNGDQPYAGLARAFCQEYRI